MSSQHLLSRAWDSAKYHVQHALLNIYGPAELDAEHDPRHDLERRHAERLSEGHAEALSDRNEPRHTRRAS